MIPRHRMTEDERDELAERAYREAVQRELDDAADKRAASGISPEILSLMDAAAEGRRAGNLGVAPSLNPYQDYTPEAIEWEKARLSVIRYRLYQKRAA